MKRRGRQKHILKPAWVTLYRSRGSVVARGACTHGAGWAVECDTTNYNRTREIRPVSCWHQVGSRVCWINTIRQYQMWEPSAVGQSTVTRHAPRYVSFACTTPVTGVLYPAKKAFQTPSENYNSNLYPSQSSRPWNRVWSTRVSSDLLGMAEVSSGHGQTSTRAKALPT